MTPEDYIVRDLLYAARRAVDAAIGDLGRADGDHSTSNRILDAMLPLREAAVFVRDRERAQREARSPDPPPAANSAPSSPPAIAAPPRVLPFPLRRPLPDDL